MGLIKKYETGDLIGRGAMGSVYRARDIVLEREVALKILHTGPTPDPELKERFYRDARVAAMLRHPNIVVVYELDEFNGTPFIAMELLTGADMRTCIRDRRPLSLAQKVELLAQVCDGLAEAHRHGIVHRDIKPSNIFLHEEKTAKILDFGIARLPNKKLTVTGRVLGTPNYMSPEQINRRPCETRSDLFSAGIVFYEFLANSHPFQSTFIPRRIAEEEPDNIYDRDPLVPKALADLLYKALVKDPDKRIQSAEQFGAGLREVLAELRRGLGGQPVHGDPPADRANPAADLDYGSADDRVAAFVQLLSAFETALNREDAAACQDSLAQMRRFEAIDERFCEALRDCQERYDSLPSRTVRPLAEAAAAGAGATGLSVTAPLPAAAPPPARAPFVPMPAAAPQATDAWDDTERFFGTSAEFRRPSLPPPDPAARNDSSGGSAQTLCPACGTANRPEAEYCRECGDRLASAPEPARPVPPRRSFADAAREKSAPVSAWISDLAGACREVLGSFGSALAGLSRGQKLIAGVALAAVLLASAAAVAIALRPPATVAVEKAVASAVVEADRTDLLADRKPGAGSIMALAKGSTVNLLEGPASRGESFVRAQFVSPKKVSPPGFVRTADLGQWASDDAAVAWSLLGFDKPADNAPESDRRQFLEKLREFGSRFPGTPQASQANLARAGLYVALANQGKSAGKPRDEWQEDAGRASEALAVAGPAGDTEISRLQEELASLKTPEPPAPQAPAPRAAAPAPDPEAIRRQLTYGQFERAAEGCYASGDWDCVLEQASLMAPFAPKQAQWWRDQVTARRAKLRKRKE